MRPSWILVFVLAPGVPAQKVPEVRLDVGSAAGSAESEAVDIAASGLSVYVVWQDARNGGTDIYFNRSLDGGGSWLAADVRLDTGSAPGQAASETPAIATSGAAVYAVWSDARNGQRDIYFNRSLDRGTTWEPAAVRLNTDGAGAADSITPRIVAEGMSLYVVWADARDDPAGGYRPNSDIYFTRSSDGGATWLSTDVRLDTDPPGAAISRGPAITVAGSAIYVGWADGRHTSGYLDLTDVYFNRSVDGGATWLSNDVRINRDPPGLEGAGGIAIAASGSTVYAVWSDGRRSGHFIMSDTYFSRSLDAGATWLPADVRLNEPLPVSSSTVGERMAASGDSIYVVWRENREALSNGSDIYLDRSLDGGVTWLANDHRVNTGPAGQTSNVFPDVACAGSSVYVVWAGDRPGGHATYFNRSTDGGSTWLPSDVQLNTDTSTRFFVFSRKNRVVASGSAVYAAWHDDRDGGDDIFFNIPFGAQPYGTGTAGSGGLVPRLTTAGSPTLGSSVSLRIEDGLGAVPGVVFVGSGPASRIATPVLGGTVLVQPALALPVVLGGSSGAAGTGTAALSVRVPDHPSVVGANVNFQAFVLDPGAPFGIAMSNAIEMWTG